jgi:6-pyruvoyltetrahydropterin/6-carboxytetrahydropterin synthase
MSNYTSTKVIELGSCAFRQYGAQHSHCQYVHGYQLKAKFWFGCKELDFRNWAVDFGGLKPLKDILQNQFDHTLCVAADDPCLDLWKQLEERGAAVLRIMPEGVGIERAAEWCFKTASDFIKEQYGDRCWVDKVEVFEHENNSAIYSKEDISLKIHPSVTSQTSSPIISNRPGV